MTMPASRPRAKQASAELRVLAHWETFVPWLLDHCARWPRAARFSLTQRLENRTLDVFELLVVARYQPQERARSLHQANLLLEQMRFLCRIAQARKFMSNRAFDKATRDIDEAGRMIYGWRQHGGKDRKGSPNRTNQSRANP